MRYLTDLPENPQAQPLVFPGYMLLRVECCNCGKEWTGVAPVGQVGIKCPHCGYTEPSYALVPEEREAIKHDGAWLWGTLDYFGALDEDEDDACFSAYLNDDDVSAFPWYIKLIALVMTIARVLRGRD